MGHHGLFLTTDYNIWFLEGRTRWCRRPSTTNLLRALIASKRKKSTRLVGFGIGRDIVYSACKLSATHCPREQSDSNRHMCVLLVGCLPVSCHANMYLYGCVYDCVYTKIESYLLRYTILDAETRVHISLPISLSPSLSLSLPLFVWQGFGSAVLPHSERLHYLLRHAEGLTNCDFIYLSPSIYLYPSASISISTQSGQVLLLVILLCIISLL